MKVALIRHAIAEEPAEFAATGQDDALRPLCARGIKKMRRVSRGLNTILPAIDLLGSSPLVRARGTADILAHCYGAVPIVEIPALAPGGSLRDCLRWLHNDGDFETVGLVGHQPDLAILAGWFLTGRKEAFMEMKKGSVCLLDFPDAVAPGGAVLLWALRPSHLIGLAGSRG